MAVSGSCCCVCRCPTWYLSRATSPSARAAWLRRRRGSALCNGAGAVSEGEDAIGELCVFSAEVVSLTDLLADDAPAGHCRAYRVLFALAVNAKHRNALHFGQLGPRWRPALVGADPVGDAHLEGGMRIDPEQADACDSLAQVGRQPVDDERQYVRSEGVADEQYAAAVPGREVVPQHARDGAGGLIRSALAPEILQRVESCGGHAVCGEARGELLVESGPAAIAREQQRELVAGAAGVHLFDRQVGDLSRALRPRLDARNESRIRFAELRHPVALDGESVSDERQPYYRATGHPRCELIRRVAVAHLVLLPLERYPWLAQRRGGLEHQLVLLVLAIVQACSRTERRTLKVLVGAEAEAHRCGERAGRRLHQRRVHDRCAGGVADQHRHVVIAHADFPLHLVTQILEVPGDHLAGRAGVLRRALQAGEILTDIDADHDGTHVGERTRHGDDSELPTAISRDEDRDALRLAVGNVDRDLTEAARRQMRRVARRGAGGGAGRGRWRRCRRTEGARGCGEPGGHRKGCDRRRGSHRAKSSFIPPAISTETSTSTRGRAMPPRAAR